MTEEDEAEYEKIIVALMVVVVLCVSTALIWSTLHNAVPDQAPPNPPVILEK